MTTKAQQRLLKQLAKIDAEQDKARDMLEAAFPIGSVVHWRHGAHIRSGVVRSVYGSFGYIGHANVAITSESTGREYAVDLFKLTSFLEDDS